jgi:predicted  nucleic acid-binding Zn-ribbon protein
MGKFEDVFGAKARLTDPLAARTPEKMAAPDSPADVDQDMLSGSRAQFASENEAVRNLLLDASKAAIGKLVDPMNNALRAIEAEKSEKIRIQTMLDKARTSYNRLRADVTEFEQKLANSSSECVALRRDLSASERQLQATLAAKAEVEKDIAGRRKQIADLAGRLALQTNESAALRDDNRRLDDRLATAERGVIALESELINARQRLCVLEDEKRAQHASLDRATGDSSRMSRRVFEAEAALKTAQDRLRQLEGDFANAHADRARLITAMDETNERHQHELAHQRKQIETLQARTKANEKLLVDARDRLLARAEEMRAHELRTTAVIKERDSLQARVAELEAAQVAREAELKKAEQARAALMEHSSQLTCAVSAKDAALARLEQSNTTLSECVSRLEAALSGEKKGASGIVGELETALRREKRERQAAEAAVEALRKDFDRLMRKVMTNSDDEPTEKPTEGSSKPAAAA